MKQFEVGKTYRSVYHDSEWLKFKVASRTEKSITITPDYCTGCKHGFCECDTCPFASIEFSPVRRFLHEENGAEVVYPEAHTAENGAEEVYPESHAVKMSAYWEVI